MLLLAAPLAGCATLTVDGKQTMEVTALDARDRPVAGMECSLTQGSDQLSFIAPTQTLVVRRAFEDIEIECKRGTLIARGTVVSRGNTSPVHTVLPGGYALTLIDHVSGRMYAYPTILRLRVGQHLRFEFGGEARASFVAAVGTGNDALAVDSSGAAPAKQPLPPAVTTQPAASTPTSTPRAQPRARQANPATEATTPQEPRRNSPVNW